MRGFDSRRVRYRVRTIHVDRPSVRVRVRVRVRTTLSNPRINEPSGCRQGTLKICTIVTLDIKIIIKHQAYGKNNSMWLSQWHTQLCPTDNKLSAVA